MNKLNMYYRPLWLIFGVVYIGIILLGSLIQVPDIKAMSFNQADKFIHFALYFILVGWFVQLYSKASRRLIILAGAILLGILIEYLQEKSTYRHFDSFDIIANTAGAGSAFLLARTSFDSILSAIDSQLHLYLSRKN